MVGEEILIEIDATLDRLICNAEAIQDVQLSDLSSTELEAFQKTQESLLQHLMHMDAFFEIKKQSLRIPDKKSAQSQIQQKRYKFETLKTKYHKNISETLQHRCEILSKRRGKRLLTLY